MVEPTPIKWRGRPRPKGYDPTTRMGVQGSDDPNPLATEGYSKRNFYTASTDQRGHGEKRTIKMPPWMDGVMDEIKRKFPQYKTDASIMRDCFVHRCHELDEIEELSEQAHRVLAREEQLSIQHQHAEEMAQLDDLAQTCMVNMKEAIAKNQWNKLEGIFEGVEAALEILEGDPLKDTSEAYANAKKVWRMNRADG